jgi:hypothetical protein
MHCLTPRGVTARGAGRCGDVGGAKQCDRGRCGRGQGLSRSRGAQSAERAGDLYGFVPTNGRPITISSITVKTILGDVWLTVANANAKGHEK